MCVYIFTHDISNGNNHSNNKNNIYIWYMYVVIYFKFILVEPGRRRGPGDATP